VHYGADRQLSAATHPLTRAHYHFNCQDQISEESCRERDVGPTCEFTASPEVGPGATIGTLQTRYPRVQASSQDSGQDVHPRAATHPATPGRPTPHPSSGGLRLCHASRGSGPHHASEMGSDVPACHMALEPTASHKRASVLARIHGTPWVVRIKKGLATSVQRGSRVTKECTHVIEVSARRVARRRYHDLQDMYASVYRATVQCSAMRLTAHGRGWHEL
jgi:hypothetical protein